MSSRILLITMKVALAVVGLIATSMSETQSAKAQAVFRVTFSKDSFPGDEYTGRVYVSVTPQGDPVEAMHSWFNPPPVFAKDVEEANPGDQVLFAPEDPQVLSHPIALNDLKPGSYNVQAVARVNLDSPKAGFGEGDLVSEVVKFEWPAKGDESLQLKLSSVVEAKTFPENDRCKNFRFRSPSLSDFHGRDVFMNAGVVLPPSWSEGSDRTYPVIYDITGFGGTHFSALRRSAQEGIIMVVPDASCYWGHSVFADSETNGPWGHALVHELIPALEKKYRGAADPMHRYATGGSSGGWASLWLQVTYPDQFNGCFSHVPDPVDFHDFQRINLYDQDSNAYVEADGKTRPLARRGNQPILDYRPFVEREEVLGPGGQIRSFEACFSPLDEEGLPMRVFDRKTGAVDVDVAESWKPYDIEHVLRTQWDELGPKLEGKLHIWAGEFDNFYLEGAVERLKETLSDLESTAVVEVIKGMGHSSHRPGQELMIETALENWKAAHLDG